MVPLQLVTSLRRLAQANASILRLFGCVMC